MDPESHRSLGTMHISPLKYGSQFQWNVPWLFIEITGTVYSVCPTDNDWQGTTDYTLAP